MKIVNDYPPVYQAILKAGMKPTKNTIYTYGDTIYVPNPVGELEDHLIEHERMHSIQQGNNPDIWWDRYLKDVYFRIDQEAEAYGMQYSVLCKQFKDRNKRNLILLSLAEFLSSPIYGKVIDKHDARRMILNKSNY